jgi:hypothetical protein
MSRVLTITMFIFTMCSATSPDGSRFKSYLNSFDEISKDKLGNFGVLLNKGKNMTEEQAIEFVYQNDTSRLFCHFQEFNMETEQRGAFTSELYLPQKCLKVTTSKFILIGYSTFECQDPNKLLEMFLTLKIIDSKTFQITDSLVVYRGTEYDWKRTGLINPQNNKIFTIERLDERIFNAQAFIYKINNALRFEVEKQQAGIKKWSDNHEKGLESLGWEDAFLKLPPAK